MTGIQSQTCRCCEQMIDAVVSTELMQPSTTHTSMANTYAENIDARGSYIYNVSGDQHNVNQYIIGKRIRNIPLKPAYNTDRIVYCVYRQPSYSQFR